MGITWGRLLSSYTQLSTFSIPVFRWQHCSTPFRASGSFVQSILPCRNTQARILWPMPQRCARFYRYRIVGRHVGLGLVVRHRVCLSLRCQGHGERLRCRCTLFLSRQLAWDVQTWHPSVQFVGVPMEHRISADCRKRVCQPKSNLDIASSSNPDFGWKIFYPALEIAGNRVPRMWTERKYSGNNGEEARASARIRHPFGTGYKILLESTLLLPLSIVIVIDIIPRISDHVH